MLIKNSSKYKNCETNKVGNFTSYSKVAVDKDIFSSFVQVYFEDRMYSAPVGYDKWLKSFYGDYMKLPPEEKRISTHKFVAFKKKKSE